MAAFEQLRTDGGPLLAAAVWTSGPSLGSLLMLFPVIFVALWRRAMDDGFAIIRLRMATGSNR